MSSSGGAAQYLECLVRLHMRVHAHRAIQFPELKLQLANNIATTGLLDEGRKRDLLDGIADRPDGNRLCHGDFHPLNILGDASQPLIIDWPDARRGDPAADVCRSYLLMKNHAAEIATAYLDAYCRASGISPQAVLGWLPYVAAARLAEDVPGELDDLLKVVDACSTD